MRREEVAPAITMREIHTKLCAVLSHFCWTDFGFVRYNIVDGAIGVCKELLSTLVNFGAVQSYRFTSNQIDPGFVLAVTLPNGETAEALVKFHDGSSGVNFSMRRR